MLRSRWLEHFERNREQNRRFGPRDEIQVSVFSLPESLEGFASGVDEEAHETSPVPFDCT
jgi:hypothetical protein